MSRTLYACVHAAEFPAQTLLRLHPELRAVPVAVLDGKAPHQFVCSINRLARQCGAQTGMTKLEAEEILNLRMVQRSPESEAAARSVQSHAASLALCAGPLLEQPQQHLCGAAA